MEKEIYKSQIETINSAKKYLKNRKNEGVDISISPFCDFVIWADCIGNENIKLINKKKKYSLGLFKNFIKELLNTAINFNYNLISAKIDTKKNFNIIHIVREKALKKMEFFMTNILIIAQKKKIFIGF